MKSYFSKFSLILGMLIVLMLGVQVVQAKEGVSINYHLEIKDFNSHEAEVTITIDGISESKTILKEEAGRNRSSAEYISKVKAVDEQGKEVEVRTIKYENEHAYEINTYGKESIIFTYTILKGDVTAETGEVVGYIGNDMGVFEGGQVFLSLTSKTPIKEMSLTFEVPEGSKVIAPFYKKDDIYYPNYYIKDSDVKKNTEYEKSRWTLLSTTIGIGDFVLANKTNIEGLDVNTYIHTSIDRQYHKQLASNIEAAISYQTELFGGKASLNDKEAYSVILFPQVCKGGKIWVGESPYGQGVAIEKSNAKHTSYAHQSFHRWNGWLWGWDLARDTVNERELAQLLIEGLDSYYGGKFIIDNIEKLFNISPRDRDYLYNSSKEFLKDYPNDPAYVKANDKYGQGAMFFLLLDLDIIQESGGEKSLDDVVGAIHKEYKQYKKELDYNKMLRVFKDVTGKDYKEFFETYIFGQGGIYKALSSYFEDTDNDGYKNYIEILKGTDIHEKTSFNIQPLNDVYMEGAYTGLLIGGKESTSMIRNKGIEGSGMGLHYALDNKEHEKYKLNIMCIHLQQDKKRLKEIQSIIPKITFDKGVKKYSEKDRTYIVIIGDNEKEIHTMIEQTDFQKLLKKK